MPPLPSCVGAPSDGLGGAGARSGGTAAVSTGVLGCAVLAWAGVGYVLAAPCLAAAAGAFTLAVLCAPLDDLLRRRVRRPWLAAAGTVTARGLMEVGPAFGVVRVLLGEVDRGAALMRDLIESGTWTRAIEARPRLVPLVRLMTEQFDIPALVSGVTSWLAGWSGRFVQGSLATAVSLMLMFYFLFYLLRDRAAIRRAVAAALPLSGAEFGRLSVRVVDTISATVLGLTAVAALQGVLGGLMFWWLGLPAPLLWGVLMGLLAVVPFLGAFVIWAPTALILAVAGDLSSAAILGLWGTVVVGLADNVMYPILVGRKLMMHSALSFVAVAGGLLLLGAAGVVLGPLILVVSWCLFGFLRERMARAGWAA